MENNGSLPNVTSTAPESIFTEQEFSMQGYDNHIRQARNAIYAVAVLLAINLVNLCIQHPGRLRVFLARPGCVDGFYCRFRFHGRVH